jgi:hypothetical protein
MLERGIMGRFTHAKNVVRTYFNALERADPESVEAIIESHVTETYLWRGVHPFRERLGASEVATIFWKPFLGAVRRIQRREDIFIGGTNELDGETWVMSMGHFMGLFDREWLGIRPTGKMINLRYAEFHCVEGDRIRQTGLFIDIIGFMRQAGIDPMTPETGTYFVYPGPRTHDGLHYEDAPAAEGAATLALVNRMCDDLATLNASGSMTCPPELLERTWHEDMIWYGPAGIGASYTIPRYQLQHQLPFRNNLKDKTFNGHVCRFAEGTYACFFGWPNLTNTPIGGFLGMPGGQVKADMQVVDVYRRQGDKLAENWVFIDLPYWLKQQGLDILERTRGIMNPDFSQSRIL